MSAQRSKTADVIVADSWTAQSQQIMAARPDLVIAAVPYQEKAVMEILKAGIRFLGLAPKTLADIYTDIATIAGRRRQRTRTGRDRGNATRDREHSHSSQLDSARRQQTSSCFCEEWGKPLIASQTLGGGTCRGGWRRLHGRSRIAQHRRNRFWQRTPMFWWPPGAEPAIACRWQKIVRDRGWEQMRAVQSGRVYCVRDELLNTPAPTLVLGLRALAAAIHPDYFPQPEGLKCILQARSQISAPQPR